MLEKSLMKLGAWLEGLGLQLEGCQLTVEAGVEVESALTMSW